MPSASLATGTDEPANEQQRRSNMAAAKKTAAPVAETTVEPTPVAESPVASTNIDMQQLSAQQADEYERLVVEHKAMQARIKELKASRPKQSKLEREIARQAAQPKWLGRFITGRVAARQRAGQPYDDALEAVLAHLRALCYDTTSDEGDPNDERENDLEDEEINR